MKTLLKALLAFVILIIIAAVLLPFIFKDKILAKVKTEINNNVNAKVDFKEFDLSVFRSFPNLSMDLAGLTVVGVADFEGDTLASIVKAAFTIDILSVIKGDKINIRTVSLEQPRIQLLVLSNGKANWDIAKVATEEKGTAETTEFKIALKKYAIDNGYILYDDRSLDMHMVMNNFNHEGSGDFTQDLFTLKTTSDIESIDFSYGGIAYLNKVKAKLKADLEMDMINSKYTFSKNEMQLNELLFGFDGFIAMPSDDINMDLKFNVTQNDFKNFISMIPGVYKAGFDKMQSSGKMAFNGFAKGTYNETKMPAFGIVLNVNNGQFKYPDLPTAVNNVGIDLVISNPDGVPDHTFINLKKLHAEMGSEPFDAHLTVKTPVSDADLDAAIKGRVDLGNISRMVPLEQGTVLKGFLDADITAKGRLSSIEKKMYENFDARGTINMRDFNYKSADFPQGAAISKCELIFNPKNITLNTLDLKSGRTDMHATGWIDNLISYIFKDNELLKGTMNISSSVIDINELMGEKSTTASADTSSMEVFEVPAGIDFMISATAGRIYYEDLVLENAKGNVAIRNNSLGLNDFSFNMLDGRIAMDGLYDTKDIKKPFFFFNLDLSQLNIKQVYDKFVAVQKLAPIAEKCSGSFSSKMNVKGFLNNKMEPVIPSFTGDGKLSTTNVTVANFNPLVKVAETLKMDQFKAMNLKNINLSFSFEDGRVKVAPFNVSIGGINSTIEGSNGFDQTIDYDLNLQIPTAMLGGAANNVVSGIFSKANQAAGTQLSMGKEVKLKVNIGGTVMSPKIQTGVKDLASSAVADVKEQVKEQLDMKKKELEDKARAEAERLKSEAENKARAETDKLKKEAEAKAKAESDRLKKEAEDKMKKQAEDKLKNLFGKPK
jgi:hypothetical protein